MANNSLNNECKNDFTITGGVSGSSRILRVENNYNTASSSAVIEHYIAGTSADDTYTSFIVGTTASYALGIDVSDSQGFKIGYNSGASATPSSTEIYHSDTDCHNFYSLQPCFRAYVTGTQTDVSGDGTIVKVQFNTEGYDIGSNYDNTTYTFTTPCDGRYLLSTVVYLEGLAEGFTGTHISIMKNGTKLVGHMSKTYPFGYSGAQAFPVYCITNMSASDTLYVNLAVYGSTKTIDIIQNGSNTNSFFSAYLIG